MSAKPTTEMRTILVPHWVQDHCEGWYLSGATKLTQQAWIVKGKKVWRDVDPPKPLRVWREPPTEAYVQDNYEHARKIWKNTCS